MKTILKYLLLSVSLSLTATPSAYAGKPHPGPSPVGAPEIDPSLAISGLAFLAGSLSVAHARRSKG